MLSKKYDRFYIYLFHCWGMPWILPWTLYHGCTWSVEQNHEYGVICFGKVKIVWNLLCVLQLPFPFLCFHKNLSRIKPKSKSRHSFNISIQFISLLWQVSRLSSHNCFVSSSSPSSPFCSAIRFAPPNSRRQIEEMTEQASEPTFSLNVVYSGEESLRSMKENIGWLPMILVWMTCFRYVKNCRCNTRLYPLLSAEDCDRDCDRNCVSIYMHIYIYMIVCIVFYDNATCSLY